MENKRATGKHILLLALGTAALLLLMPGGSTIAEPFAYVTDGVKDGDLSEVGMI
jgi:hypothetical protein